jgi:hypothetical protein
MYVIEEGQVQLSRHGMIISVLTKDGFIGDSALQPGRRLRDRSAYALTDANLALLTKADCTLISKDYPNLLGAFEKIGARKAKIEAIRMNELLQVRNTPPLFVLRLSDIQKKKDHLPRRARDNVRDVEDNSGFVCLRTRRMSWVCRYRARRCSMCSRRLAI